MGWFYLSWMIIVSAVYVFCQELTTLLPQDDDACARNEVNLICTIRGSPNLTSLILAWSSNEYIGSGKVLRFLSIDTPGMNTTSMINGNVTAILTSNTVVSGVPELVSVLRIVGANQRSVITCESVTNESSANTVVSVSALPGQPLNVVARQLSAGNCDFLVTWNPPTNVDGFDINRYIIYVPSRNIMNVSFSTTAVVTVPNCRDDDSIQVAAVNRLGCVGPNSSLIQPNLLEMPTAQDIDTTIAIAALVFGVLLFPLVVVVVIAVCLLLVCYWKGSREKCTASRNSDSNQDPYDESSPNYTYGDPHELHVPSSSYAYGVQMSVTKKPRVKAFCQQGSGDSGIDTTRESCF